MKSLVEFLHTNMTAEVVNESKEKYIRFTPGDLKNAQETIDSLRSLADKAGIYNEKTDNGIKFKAKEENKDKFDSIKDVIQQYVQSLQDDEEADKSKVEAIASQLNKLTSWIESEEPKDEPKDDDDDKSKKDDEKDDDEE